MKKYIIIILVAMFHMAQAQHVNVGVKLGLNSYSIQNDNIDYDPAVNFHLGLLGHIHLDRQLALQPELVYSNQGAVAPSGAKLTLSYLNIPVLFQYMFDNGFRLQAGPQVGFLMSAKSKLNSSESDLKKDLTSTDVAIAAGIGYVHPPSGIGFDVRYNFGVSNINKNSTVQSMNNGLQFGLFYLFGHK